MGSFVRVVLVLCVGLGIVACSKNSEPPSPAATQNPPPAPAPADGSPRIVNSADGVHIEYHVYGSGEPAVVLIHGWSCDGNYWQKQVAPLKAKYTTVTVDLAGHGASGANRTDWSIAVSLSLPLADE